ncbi:hypothetical protein MYAM1_002610 [Malassezia yamatoensis]|uniref:Uncharacterized protein n=1 Tax=Malassezia yamatoensis TaxID=253288 RepID=A0AAJ5Z0A3_9BASI|nr:hypothetical protein MYAM1_002610 [Malassezia yamatoensis]
MSNRIAALKALYEGGAQDQSEGSIDQSIVPSRNDATLDFDLEDSLSLRQSGGASGAFLSSTDAENTGVSQEESDSQTISSSEDSTTSLPQKKDSQASFGNQATPRKGNQATSASHTPTTASRKARTDATPSRAMTLDDLDESSLSASLRASQLLPNEDAVDELLEDDAEASQERSRSGHWGVQEMQRRTAAGISIKSTQQKIDQLTAERDDLKIEVDFHRRNMSPDDVGAEVISLRQEKLAYVRRLQKLNELVKGQDQALKTVNKQVKAWETKIQDYDGLQERLSHAEQQALTAQNELEALQNRSTNQTKYEELEAALRTQQLENEALERELATLSEAQAQASSKGAQESRDAEWQDLRADLQAAEEEIDYLRNHPQSAETDMIQRLQHQIDDHQETIASLQDALAAERLILAEKDGELDRMDQEQQELHNAYTELQQELAIRTESESNALKQAQQLDAENQRLEQELQQAHSYHEGLTHALRDKLSDTAMQLNDAQRTTEVLHTDLDQIRNERDSLLDLVERQDTKHAELEALNSRLNAKLIELVKDLKDEEDARERADSHWTQRYTSSEVQTKRAIETQAELIESLEAQVSQLRKDKQQIENEHRKLQRSLQSQDTQQVRRQQDHEQRREALETDRVRYEREATRLATELERVQSQLEQAEEHLAQANDHTHHLQTESKELASALQTEVRARLHAQERLEVMQKQLEDSRTASSTARSRRSDLDRSPGSARKPDGCHPAQLAERNQLLATVYEQLIKILSDSPATAGIVRKHGADDRSSTDAQLVYHHYSQFSERMLLLVRRFGAIRTKFEQRTRAIERDQTDQLTTLRRQQETRLGQIERIERSIKTAVAKQGQWRKRLADTEAEFALLQKTNHALQQQLTRVRDPVSANDLHGSPTTKASDTPTRWSVRLRELEQRVKEAEERVKRERLGAREARARDEAKIRYVVPPPPTILTNSHLQTLVQRLDTPPAA